MKKSILIFISCLMLSSCGVKNKTNELSQPEKQEVKTESLSERSKYEKALYTGESIEIGSSTSTKSFTNKYGSSTTKCAIAGCENYTASSGDTNCCAEHSNRCGNCNKYIDSDALFCMDCLEDALN